MRSPFSAELESKPQHKQNRRGWGKRYQNKLSFFSHTIYLSCYARHFGIKFQRKKWLNFSVLFEARWQEWSASDPFLSMETRKTFFWNVSDSYLGFRLFGAIWKTDGFNEKLSFYRKYQRQHIRASGEQNAKVSYELEKILSCVVIRARCFFILPENEMGLRMTYESISEVLVKGYKSDATATKI